MAGYCFQAFRIYTYNTPCGRSVKTGHLTHYGGCDACTVIYRGLRVNVNTVAVAALGALLIAFADVF